MISRVDKGNKNLFDGRIGEKAKYCFRNSHYDGEFQRPFTREVSRTKNVTTSRLKSSKCDTDFQSQCETHRVKISPGAANTLICRAARAGNYHTCRRNGHASQAYIRGVPYISSVAPFNSEIALQNATAK